MTRKHRALFRDDLKAHLVVAREKDFLCRKPSCAALSSTRPESRKLCAVRLEVLSVSGPDQHRVALSDLDALSLRGTFKIRGGDLITRRERVQILKPGHV